MLSGCKLCIPPTLATTTFCNDNWKLRNGRKRIAKFFYRLMHDITSIDTLPAGQHVSEALT